MEMRRESAQNLLEKLISCKHRLRATIYQTESDRDNNILEVEEKDASTSEQSTIEFVNESMWYVFFIRIFGNVMW